LSKWSLSNNSCPSASNRAFLVGYDIYRSGIYGLTLRGLDAEGVKTFKEALKIFFTQDEAALAIQLKLTPETIANLCKKDR
jgi:hypothetical protein